MEVRQCPPQREILCTADETDNNVVGEEAHLLNYEKQITVEKRSRYNTAAQKKIETLRCDNGRIHLVVLSLT